MKKLSEKKEKSLQKPLSILNIGAGAVGGFYSGKLAQQKQNVSVVCRSEYNFIKKNGFAIKSNLGGFDFKPKKVYENTTEIEEDYDLILITTKVLPEINTLELIKPLINPNTVIMLLQNGIDIEREIKEAYPNNELISGLAFVCLNRIGAGQIVHQDYGRLVFGNYPNGCSALCLELEWLFQESGIKSKATENVQYERWKKLLWNAPFNPLSVVTGGKNTKEIIEDPVLYERSKNIMKEVQALARSEEIELGDDLIEKNLNDTLKMTPYKTSMLLDYEAGRPLETEAILGNAIKVGGKNGIELVFIRELYDELKII